MVLRFCRKWRTRRVVYTNEVIAFSNVADDRLLDQIPLEDIIGIDEIQASSEASPQIDSTIEAHVDFTNAFQIRTRTDGYNGGRGYFLRSESGGDVASLIQGIALVAKVAARKARGRTKWGLAQEHARSVYNSILFQGIASFLIIAVSAVLMATPPCRPVIPSAASRISASPSSRRSCSRTTFTEPTDRRPPSSRPWTQ